MFRLCYAEGMKRQGRKTEYTARTVATGALLAALGTAVMLLGGIVPVFTYCSPLLASLFLIPMLDLYGKGPSLATWCVTSALSLLIGADKEAAFFYLFLGWYPVLKPRLDALPGKLLRILLKVLVFAGATGIMYWLTCRVLGIEEIAESFSASRWLNLAFFAAMVGCMLLFDTALNRLTLLYRLRLKGRIVK